MWSRWRARQVGRTFARIASSSSNKHSELMVKPRRSRFVPADGSLHSIQRRFQEHQDLRRAALRRYTKTVPSLVRGPVMVWVRASSSEIASFTRLFGSGGE